MFRIIPSVSSPQFPRIFKCMMARPIYFATIVTIFFVTSSSSESNCTSLFWDKIITVSRNGRDREDCLSRDAGVPCATLGYVLRELQSRGKIDHTLIDVDYDHDLTSSLYISGVCDLAIVGGNDPILNCSQGSGISFTDSANIFVYGISWEGCSISHYTTYLDASTSTPLNATSALFFYLCINVTISGCRFTSEWGAGVSLYDVGGTVNITETEFVDLVTPRHCLLTNNANCILLGGGLSITLTHCGNFSTCEAASVSEYNSFSTYMVTRCLFSNNTDMNSDHCAVNLHGNALSLSILGASTENTYIISDNTFQHNVYSCRVYDSYTTVHATSSIQLASDAINNKISVAGNSYHSNAGANAQALYGITTGALFNNYSVSQFDGGGLSIDIQCHNSSCSGNTIAIADCNFFSNTATAGAVIVVVSSGQGEMNLELLNFSNCSWEENTANVSGAAISLFGTGSTTLPIGITFEDCTWKSNSIPYPSNKIVNNEGGLAMMQHYGTLMSELIPILLSGDTIFSDNTVTALYLNLAPVSLAGDIHFVNNTANSGGAIYLGNLAWIIPLDNLRLNFTQNRARSGGAIYTTFQCYNASNTAYCTTFGYKNGTKLCPSTSNLPDISISFSHNHASISGDAIYLDSRTCNLNCLHGSIFSYLPSEDNQQVAAPATRITFHSPAVQDNMDIMLGQDIYLNVTTSNEYTESNQSFTVSAVAVSTVYLNCYLSIDSPYTLIGPTVVYFENTAFYSGMNVKGPEITKHTDQPRCTLEFVTTGSQPVLEQSLTLNFRPCRLGFVYNKYKQICTCYDSTDIRCDAQTLDVCIKYGSWFGNISENVFTLEVCPPGHCNFNYGMCGPSGSCGPIPGFCSLPYVQDNQCSGHRSGVLCTRCAVNYSFTFGADMCVNSDTCSIKYAVIPILLVIAFWTGMIVSLLLILKMNLRLGSGYVYSFIYYFSVIRYITPAYLPSNFLNIVVTIFGSIAKLKPTFVGQVPVCFIKPLNSIGHQFFQYLHPLLISLAILIVIAMGRCCPRLPNPTKHSGVHAICILILLSFSSLVETSFNLLNPVRFHDNSNHSDVFVNIQADIRFFDPRRHLPYALIAILVLVVIVIPFMFLLLVSPFLMRFGVNLTKIKPILDEYQACYRDKWRWVASYYFICRFIVFFISVFDIGVYGNIYIMQIIFVFIFGFHTAIQPYESSWLNAVDAFFLLDLTFVTLMYGSTADQLFLGSAAVVRDIVLHILILIPCLYFTGFVVYILVSLARQKCFRKCQTEELKVTDESGTATPAPTTTSLSSYEASHPEAVYGTDDREPLLALLPDNGAYGAHAHYQAIHQQQGTRGKVQENEEAEPQVRKGSILKASGGHKLPYASNELCTSQQWQNTDNESSEGDNL